MPEPLTTRWIALARILRPQGRKGEVLADLLTDFPEQFDTHPRVFLAAEGFSGTQNQARSAEVVGFWLPVGRNVGRIVLQIGGTESINAAETLSGLYVLIPEDERPELEEGANYVGDLIGCVVFNASMVPDGVAPVLVGVVTDVEFPTTPDGGRRLKDAAPLLAVGSPDGDEILIPFAKAFIVSLDPATKRIEMRLPSGLLDVNRR